MRKVPIKQSRRPYTHVAIDGVHAVTFRINHADAVVWYDDFNMPLGTSGRVGRPVPISAWLLDRILDDVWALTFPGG